MSSSGLIYAGIVGAWAMYLVPVWLRREEQLNEARKKARYAAAIRTLGRTEQFERRVLEEEVLAATGTDGPLRPPGEAGRKPAPKPAAKPAAKTPAPHTSDQAVKDAAPRTPAKKPGPAAAGKRQPAVANAEQTGLWRPAAPAVAAQSRRPGVTSRIPHSHHQQARPATTARQRLEVRRRGVLLMRRRRVVAFLFTLATAGAAVSAVLGLAYIWAMLVPATLFSVYIVNIRRDERLRAAERYRRRQAQLAAERRKERDRERERRRLQADAAAEAEAEAEQEQRRRQARNRTRDRLHGTGNDHPEEYRRAANG